MWSNSVVVCQEYHLSLHVTEWSRRGLPCVLLHGLGDTAGVWGHLATRIMSQFAAVAMDLRGHGDSDWDPDARYDTETLTADLAKVVAAFGFGRIVLIGHSLGADVAIRFAADHPSRVAALVIVDFGPELAKAGVDEVMRGLIETPRNFESAEDYAQWLMARRPFAQAGALRQFARSNLRPSPSGGWELKADAALATRSQMSKLIASNGRYGVPDLWPALARIKCPSLIVRGMASGVLPHDVATRMVERTHPAGRLATVGAAGHAVMMDNPVEFSAGVVSFLAGLRT